MVSKKYFLLIVILIVFGCEEIQKIQKKPDISVKRTESDSQGVIVIVEYHDHVHIMHGCDRCYVELHNLEEVQDYSQKVKFLLNQLEEVKKRMTVHED